MFSYEMINRMSSEQLRQVLSKPRPTPLARMFMATWKTSRESVFRDYRRYVTHDDSQRAWGSPEHVSREMPW